jgi:galactokinase
MGKRIAEASADWRWSWVSELPAAAVDALPEALDGAAFLDRWSSTDDALTAVDAVETYPVRAATAFGVEEHARSRGMLDALSTRETRAIGRIMAASHAGYDAMGLGHPAATVIVDGILGRPGVHGARSSGGGAGGTVVVLCEHDALEDVSELIR